MTTDTGVASRQERAARATLSDEDAVEEPILVELKNPSDALEILASTTSHRLDDEDSHEALAIEANAAKDNDAGFDSTAEESAGDAVCATTESRTMKGRTRGIKDYKPVAQGLVDVVVIERLIQL